MKKIDFGGIARITYTTDVKSTGGTLTLKNLEKAYKAAMKQKTKPLYLPPYSFVEILIDSWWNRSLPWVDLDHGGKRHPRMSYNKWVKSVAKDLNKFFTLKK